MKAHRLVAGISAGLLWLSLGVLAQERPELKAQQSDEAWLALVDSSKYAESWKAASPAFQAAITEESWAKTIGAVRSPLGKVESRKLTSAKYAKSLPGAPDGEYVIIEYETSFEKKANGTETVVPMKDTDGEWRVSGYFVK